MPAETAAQKHATLQYLILAVLFLITAAYHAKHIKFIADYLSWRVDAVRAPGSMERSKPIVSRVELESEQAGVRVGDTLLEVNGKPYKGAADLARAIEYAQGGDSMRVTVQHTDGRRQELLIPLVRRTQSASDHWLFVIALHGVLPLSCVALGFWVAAVRPRERVAWILLALLLGFSQMFGLGAENQDGTLASNLALGYKVTCASTWVLWLLMLGVYFPEQLGFERRHPWLKWIVLVPLGGLAAVGIAYTLLSANSFAAAAYMNTAIRGVGAVGIVLILFSIAAFFVAIIAKYFVASTRDAKRRLRLLYFGMFLALMPTVSLLIVGAIQRKSPDDYPGWVELPCLLLTLMFPITLAYIIVVYRAMDIRVVLRQGLQYTLARRGVSVLQALLTAGLVMMIARLAQSRATSLPEGLIVAVGIAAIFLLRRGARRLAKWIDRRFFRDSYNTEQLMLELSEEVRTIVEVPSLLEKVSRRVSESLHVPKVAVLLQEEHPYRLAYSLGYESATGAEFAESSGTVRQLREAKQPARVYLEDPNNWVNRTQEIGDNERSTLRRLQSELLVPLLAMGRLLGFISLSQKRSEEPYSRTDLQLLGSVAAQTGLALENARLTSAVAEEAAQREAMKREVEIAREVQERLFPQHPPKVEGLDYCGTCRPARGVGGDYYDFLLLPGGLLGVAVGDVSGKGISAALMMASLQASLRGQTMLGPENMAALVKRVNQLVYEVSSPERYATFFFAQYDAVSRVLTYVNAGHNPPMVLSRCGEEWKLKRLEVGGMVVGLFPEASYNQDSVKLNEGDVLAAFTDGISEAMNLADEEWGEENLLATLKECEGQSAAETVTCIMAAADQFTAGAKQYDDMTVVVMKVE
ncbi:MAG: SpoIIE family protein phosphatase [Candidatus Korobacteraceae bacterium]|jgi:sigma-B regulation protein RsbU (phosphoserine phosphatase)